jgi:hypothetical protein
MRGLFEGTGCSRKYGNYYSTKNLKHYKIEIIIDMLIKGIIVNISTHCDHLLHILEPTHYFSDHEHKEIHLHSLDLNL